LLLEVGHVQPLDVVVGGQAQVVLDVLGQVAPADGLEVVEQGLEAPQDGRQQADADELVAHVDEAELGQDGVFARDDDVDGHADEHRRGEVEDFVEDGVEGGDEDAAVVGLGVAGEAAQGVAGGGRFVHGGMIAGN